ncbi:MAG TPA: helix-turn-helix domain-containing protein [Kofleriaceae bacterium]|nr:helix-turn-helix domain-containing protein [Kofleriaceae bacterium]
MSAANDQRPRVIAFGSGKGGAGKSLLCANVGIFFATLGKRVILVDGAGTGASLHVYVGADTPPPAARVIAGQAAGTPVPGLLLVQFSGPGRELCEAAREANADYVLVDLPAHRGADDLDAALDADVTALVNTPEPPAIELTYRFLRAAFVRRMERAGLAADFGLAGDAARELVASTGTPVDFLKLAKARSEDLHEAVKAEILAVEPRLIMNGVRSKSDMDLATALATAARRRLGVPLRHLGHIEYDDAVWVSLRRRRPLLIEHPECRAAKCIEKLARKLLARDSDRHDITVGGGDTLYDLLDVDPSASDEDIRRANRRMHQDYKVGSAVVGGLLSAGDIAAHRDRLDEAYDTLMDPVRRKAYDQALYPEGVPVPTPAAPTSPVVAIPAVDRPPMPALDEEVELTGAILQQVREAQGLDLREISERTKIGMTYLSAIETERFDKLPAAVYVRGFLVEYAKIIGIDVDRVVESYLRRLREGAT